MEATPLSLLERLKRPAAQDAWARFVRLYTPLLYHWARRLGLPAADAGDLVQEVFTVLVRKLPHFTYDPHQRFRGWLWTVTLNKLRESRRRQTVPTEPGDEMLASLAEPDPSEILTEDEYRRHLAGRALRLMQAEFHPTTWRAFLAYVTEGRPAADVAAELGISVGAVYAAKVRVLKRLREELRGLLD